MQTTAVQILIEDATSFTHPTSRTARTTTTAQDEILRVAAITAGYDTLTRIQAGALDRRTVDMIGANVAFDVQSARLASYATW